MEGGAKLEGREVVRDSSEQILKGATLLLGLLIPPKPGFSQAGVLKGINSRRRSKQPIVSRDIDLLVLPKPLRMALWSLIYI